MMDVDGLAPSGGNGGGNGGSNSSKFYSKDGELYMKNDLPTVSIVGVKEKSAHKKAHGTGPKWAQDVINGYGSPGYLQNFPEKRDEIYWRRHHGGSFKLLGGDKIFNGMASSSGVAATTVNSGTTGGVGGIILGGLVLSWIFASWITSDLGGASEPYPGGENNLRDEADRPGGDSKPSEPTGTGEPINTPPPPLAIPDDTFQPPPSNPPIQVALSEGYPGARPPKSQMMNDFLKSVPDKGFPHTLWVDAGLTDPSLRNTTDVEIFRAAFLTLLENPNVHFNYNRTMSNGLIMNTFLATNGKVGSGMLQWEFRELKKLYLKDPSRVTWWEHQGGSTFTKSKLEKHPL
jgi:hypothetical protein